MAITRPKILLGTTPTTTSGSEVFNEQATVEDSALSFTGLPNDTIPTTESEVVDITDLGGAVPELPTPPVPTTDPSALLAGATATATTPTTGTTGFGTSTPAPTATETEGTDFGKLFEERLLELEAPDDPAARRKAFRESLAIADKEKSVNDLTARLNAINAESQAQKLKIEGQQTSVGLISGMQQDEERKRAIRALPIAAQLSAAQGNLSMALGQMETALTEQRQFESDTRQFRLDQLSGIKELANKQEQKAIREEERRLNSEEKASDRLYNFKTAMTSSALATNNGDLVESIMAATTEEEIGRIASGISDPMFNLELNLKLAQLEGVKKKNALIGVPTPEDIEESRNRVQQQANTLIELENKKGNIDSLVEHSGLGASVGANVFTRKASGFLEKAVKPFTGTQLASAKDFVTGDSKEFAGHVKNLISGLTLQELADAKAKGITFGALSEKELQLIGEAATAISQWEIKDDKGIGIGLWDVSEAAFVEALGVIKTNLALAESNAIDNLFTTDEDYELDAIFSADAPLSSYYDAGVTGFSQ